MMQIGLCIKETMLSFFKGISPTKPFKETNLVFFLVVAIQIVLKPGKENALEPLILSQSETGFLNSCFSAARSESLIELNKPACVLLICLRQIDMFSEQTNIKTHAEFS